MASRFGMGTSGVTQPPYYQSDGYPTKSDGYTNQPTPVDSQGWSTPYNPDHEEIFQEIKEEEEILGEGEDKKDGEVGEVEKYRLENSRCVCCMCPNWLCVLCLLVVILVILAAIVIPIALTQRTRLVTIGGVDDVSINGTSGGKVDIKSTTKTPQTPPPALSSTTTKTTTLPADISTSSTMSTPVSTTKGPTGFYTSSRFWEFQNTSSRTGSSKTEISGVQTLAECTNNCLKSDPLCFGLDYGETSLKCYLLTDQDYILEKEGTVEKMLHKKRDFQVDSSCKYESTESSNAPIWLANSVQQSSDVDTAEKCKLRCESTFMTSGKHCRVAAFSMGNKTCYLFDDHTTKVQSSTWTFYIVDFNCNLAHVPYSINSFSSTRATFPPDILSVVRSPTTTEMNATDAAHCAELSCKLTFKMFGGPTCHDFIFDKQNKMCSIVSRSGSDFDMREKVYYRAGALQQAQCSNYEETQNSRGAEGRHELGSPRELTIEECRKRCVEYEVGNSGRCYGYEMGVDMVCVGLLDPGYTLHRNPDTTNYRRNLLCEVSPKPYFVSTINTMPPMGTRLQSAKTVYECSSECIKATTQVCYGFAFNYDTYECFHYTTYDFQLGRVGENPGVVTFRRQFTSAYTRPELCKNSFTSVNDLSVTLQGFDQPWDINTEERCKDRCIGLNVATEQVCYAIDFNTEKRSCILYNQRFRPDQLIFSPGVIHARRDNICSSFQN